MCVIVRASERGGGRGVNDPGAHGLQRGPIMGPLASHADFSVSFRCLFFFGNHLIAIGKTVRISVKTFFFYFWRSPNSDRKNRYNFGEDPFFFWRSHHILDKTAAFSPSVLEFTKLEIRNICASPGPTFGSRRPWL